MLTISHLDAGRETLLKSQLGFGDQLVVQSNVELVVLLSDVVGSNTRTKSVGWCQDQRQIDVLGLGVPEIIADLEQLSVADHLVDSSEAKLGHDGTELVGDVVEEVDDVLRSTIELLAKLRILGSDTNRACVQMASIQISMRFSIMFDLLACNLLSHHDTAHGDQEEL